MDNIRESRHDDDDTIGLVELATILIRRRRIFFGTFLFAVTLGVIAALFLPEKHEYVSLIQLAENGDGDFLEAPGVVGATIESRWVPEREAVFLDRHGRGLPFGVRVDNPKGTGLIRLITKAGEEQRQLVSEVHSGLIDKVHERQQKLFDSARKSIDTRIESQDAVIDALQAIGSGENTASALASALQEKAELEGEKAALQAPEVLVTSRRAASTVGPAKLLIISLALILGLLGGLTLAFLSEFVAVVRANINRLQTK